MKILFIIESLRAGGKERRIVELLKGLKKHKELHLELVLTRTEIHYEEIYTLDIPIHIIERKYIKKDPLVFFKLYSLTKRINPDIIHVWGHMVAVYSVPTKILLGIPLVNNEITDATPDKNKLGKNIVFLNSDRIISNTAAGLKAYKAPMSKSTVIYNGFNFDRLIDVEGKEVIRKRFEIETEYVVAMVATFYKYKDYGTYIKAAQMVLDQRDDVTFLCVGDGDDSPYRKLVSETHRNRIRFLGRQAKVESIMNVCDIGVLTTNVKTHGEGISNALMEFMALGKPVITTNYGGSVELVEDGVSGYLIEGFDFSTLTDRILHLLNNKDEKIRIGEQAYKTVTEKFSIDRMVNDFYTEYKSFVKRAPVVEKALNGEKKIKVMMVGLLPLDLTLVKGGVVSVIMNLFSGFRKLENVNIIHVSFNEELEEPIMKKYSDNITIHYVPYRSRVKLIDYFVNKKYLKDLMRVEKPDIVHIQEITPHLIRFINWPKENIVVTQHGVMKEGLKYAVGINDKLKFLFKTYVEKYIFPLFKNIIFISSFNKNLFHHNNIVSINIFNPVSPIFFGNQKSSPVSNSIIYVAVIKESKNLKIVIQALAMLKKKNIIFDLHVIGGFKTKRYEKEIHSLIHDNGLTAQIKFYGWLTGEQILGIYDKCGIFILPSRNETLPVSIGEAMAQGKVVIASNVGAVSEMIKDEISGLLFESNNVEQLTTVIKLLDNNPNLVESISANAMKEAHEKFHPDLIASQTLDFYFQVLNGRKS